MLRFVINLDSSTERLESISARLNELGISFERMPAVNGRLLLDEQITELTYPYDHFESKVRYPRELTKGEVGCFLSHRKCWQKLLDSTEDWALIMEDDILISDIAAPYMKSPHWIPNTVQLCQLSCLKAIQKGKIRQETIDIDPTITLVGPLAPPPVGCQCYLISRSVARLALKTSQKLVAPVDDFLFSLWFDIANTYTVWRTSPTLVIPRSDVDSDVGSRAKKDVRKAPFWVRHGLSRFLLEKTVKKIQNNGSEFVFTFKQ